MSTAAPTSPDLVATNAAQAVADALPSSAPLNVTPPQPGTADVTAAFAGAVVTSLNAGASGAIAILVGADLVETVKSQEGMQLAAAVQPALDAAAVVAGGAAEAGREVPLDAVVDLLGEGFLAIPMIGTGLDAALLLSTQSLQGSTIHEDEEAQPDLPQALDLPPTPAAPAQAAAPVAVAPSRGLDMLAGVDMELTVELGRARMSIKELLALAPGDVLELDRSAGSPADLLVNGRLIARGEVVVVDEDFGLRISEILDSTES